MAFDAPASPQLPSVACTQFLIPSGSLAAALLFAAKKDVRFYLNGVCLDVRPSLGRYFLVTTDGHRMLVQKFHLAEKSDAPDYRVILERADIEGYLKVTGKKPDNLLAVTDGKWSGNSTAGQIPLRVVDGRFPDWERVMPAGGAVIGMPPMDPEYFADVGKAATLFGAKFRGPNCSWCGSQDRAALFSFPYGPHNGEAWAVVMPMRVDTAASFSVAA